MEELQAIIENLLAEGYLETEIASRLRVSQATISRWRRGVSRPALPGLVVAELRRMLEEGKAVAATRD